MAVVDELVTLLGLETDPSAKGEAKSFSELVGGVRKASLAAGTALIALSGAAFAMAKQFAGTADESGKFAASVGINIKKLQELEFATERAGGSSSELRGDLDGLAKTFGSADRGIDTLIRQFDGMSDSQAKLAGQSFGVSESTIRLLREGSAGIADLRAEFRALGGGLPDDAVEKAKEFNDEWLNLKTAIGGLSGVVSTALLPAFTASNQSLREFLVNNRELITSGLDQFVRGVQKGFADFGKIIDAVSDFIKPLLGDLGGLAEGLEFVDIIGNLVTGTLVVFAALLAPIAIKLALIAAAAIAVGIAIDDVITFFKGGDSAIGRFFDAFEERAPALFDFWKSWFELLKGGFDLIIEGAKIIGELISTLLPDIGGFFGGALDLLNSGAEALGFGGDEEEGEEGTSPRTKGPRARTDRPDAPIPATTVNNTANNSQGGTSNNTFNINGAGDPRAVASEVARRGGLGSATQTLSPGPRAPRVG